MPQPVCQLTPMPPVVFGKTVFQDWLGMSPVYYNIKNGKISADINEVIDFCQLDFDPEGLNNYIKFGYSVFGRTPVRDVYFLRQNESLHTAIDNVLSIIKQPDPCLARLSSVCPESRVWETFQHSLENISHDLQGNSVCIPTSGGLDSRLINYFYPEKSSIRAFTYGISSKQQDSFESVHAEQVCRKLGIKWERIELGGFNRFLPDILTHFGASTHAHGMYHWEFYKKIKAARGAMPMISGIVGDAWAGSPITTAPSGPDDLLALGYSHGMNADSSQCLLKSGSESVDQEFIDQRELLRDERYRVLYLVRTKMILLSYLMRVPDLLGFRPTSPFVEFEVAMSMLTVEPNRWRERYWQREFVAQHGLDVESISRRKSYRNDLDFISMIVFPLPRLDTKLLSRLFKRSYLDWINANIMASKPHLRLLHKMLGTRGAGRLLRLSGVGDTALRAYSAYLVLSPIQDLLVRAEAAQNPHDL